MLKEFMESPDFLYAPEVSDASFAAGFAAFSVALAADYEIINDALGRLQQLQRWRASLNLPSLSVAELCVRFGASFVGDERDQCPARDMTMVVITSCAAVGGAIVLLVLLVACRAFFNGVRRKAELEERADALIRKQVQEATGQVIELQTSMVLMRADHFVAMGQLRPHEDIR